MKSSSLTHLKRQPSLHDNRVSERESFCSLSTESSVKIDLQRNVEESKTFFRIMFYALLFDSLDYANEPDPYLIDLVIYRKPLKFILNFLIFRKTSRFFSAES